ncbi:MAG: methylaspartate ammonia-lyase [Oscillospiraceae bacterium]|nr:methylaspartate ammonia-lyase [Oscillospiraceae bacterium]
MKIIDVICAPGRTGFYFDDQKAIKKGAEPDGAAYKGTPVTDGFTSVRQAGEAISVMFLLEDGQIAWGDCAAVQYSGAGGRDPVFLAANFIPFINEHIKPVFLGKEITTFRAMAQELEVFEVGGNRLHTAIRYGISQAILDAVAKSRHKMMCEVISEEYGTTIGDEMIPIFTQSGDSRYENSDKMIIKGAQVLPHGLINHVGTKLGEKGELLEEYISWLRNRIIALRTDPNYSPILHLDVYGTIGMVFGTDPKDLADYLARLEKAAHPFKLRIEGPMDVEHRTGQMEALRELTKLVDERGINVEIVADEWCNTLEDIKYFADNKAGHMVQIKTPDLGGIGNTVEAVLYCKERGIGAYQGGTCNETDRSAQVCVHLAMATAPDQILAKPGMGVDEGYMIVYNEMQRILAIANARKSASDNSDN